MAQINQKIISIQQAIRNSKVGQQLSTIERWQKFRSEETTDLWIELLGPTAIVLTHQEFFLNFVKQWILQLNEHDLRKLLLAISIHDLGEAKL